ncbi:MAG: hypothetical protein H6Q70_4286 [Firmicutes bacterium]|nr:hypothetical protein [Bacillota bacterium]
MSVSASLDIKLIQRQTHELFSVKIIEKLLDYGWNFKNEGVVSFLPVGDKNNFDWQSNDISLESLINILENKEKAHEIIGIVMTWKDTGIGGEFLIIENQKISINLSINRRFIGDDITNLKITDVNWYLSKLLPAFRCEDILLEYFCYQEHV